MISDKFSAKFLKGSLAKFSLKIFSLNLNFLFLDFNSASNISQFCNPYKNFYLFIYEDFNLN